MSPADAEPTVEIPVVTQPAITTRAYAPLGIDSDGAAIVTDGTDYFRTVDGGANVTEITPNIGISPSLWVDSQGNRYTYSSGGIWRAPAGTWTFVQMFAFDEGSMALFSFAEDGVGGVYAANYSSNEVIGREFAYSHDWGATWTVIDLSVYLHRHSHAIHYHQPSGKLYLSLGEPVGAENEGRRILVSHDRGATWAVAYDGRADLHQPVSAVTVGDYIVWGHDSVPTGFLVHDTRTDTFTQRTVKARNEALPTFYSGFYYLQSIVGEVVHAPGRPLDSQATSVSPFTVMDDLETPLAVWSPLVARQIHGTAIYGPDVDGNLWIEDVAGTGSLVMKPVTVDRKTAKQVARTRNLAGVADFDGIAMEVAGVTYEGLNVFELAGSASALPTPARIAVSTTDLTVVFLARRGAGVENNFRCVLTPYIAGVAQSNVNRNVNLREFEALGDYRRVSCRMTVPASTDEVRVSFNLINVTTPGNEHRVVSKVCVYEGGDNDPAFAPDGAFEDTVDVVHLFRADTMFVDRIYELGVSGFWPETVDFPLLTLGTLEIGLTKPAAAADGEAHIYIDDDGVRTNITAGRYGATLDKDRPPVWGVSTGIGLSATIVPPPISIGIVNDKVLVIDPETNAVAEVTLGAAISGTQSVTMSGTAYHIPELLTGVESADREGLLRGTLAVQDES